MFEFVSDFPDLPDSEQSFDLISPTPRLLIHISAQLVDITRFYANAIYIELSILADAGHINIQRRFSR
jgi:hypothetical protein